MPRLPSIQTEPSRRRSLPRAAPKPWPGSPFRHLEADRAEACLRIVRTLHASRPALVSAIGESIPAGGGRCVPSARERSSRIGVALARPRSRRPSASPAAVLWPALHGYSPDPARGPGAPLPATGAIPLARWDRTGVTGFVRKPELAYDLRVVIASAGSDLANMRDPVGRPAAQPGIRGRRAAGTVCRLRHRTG